ncbi:hypothetical protein BN946_scf184951.g36 [Trametes cinnabarina]|uniref:C3H1-type domain-containing protein n=1 Tax=Pycnoporus cinnabarinus TaxID=5643 RepID=A0A060STT3_PYCCI|nr:hypothetical protein BN946_scf184951.g36 [Trametes cinnabarina]
MDMPSSSAAALKLEIERLKGAINRHKSGESTAPPRSAGAPAVVARTRSNVYVNPNYKPPAKTVRPPVSAPIHPRPAPRLPVSLPQQKRDVVIDGIAFESSGLSLVRKDLPKPPSKPPSTTAVKSVPRPPMSQSAFVRNKAGILVNSARTYKPKMSRRGRPMNRNLTLNNTRGPYQSVSLHPTAFHTAFTAFSRSRRLSIKRAKYSDKPCPRFTSTARPTLRGACFPTNIGSCNRGLTCMYQHDPNKVAICWAFLQGNCPHSAETCPLSHDPTPERTPLCVHFANNGRCTRPNCPFPHVRVGPREGICRDFAVLGYCEKGLDCDKQHVRECPDFAEKGQCTTKGCKLPHVIRANRKRKQAPLSTANPPASSSTSAEGSPSSGQGAASSAVSESADGSHGASSSRQVTAEDGQLGDEFISLTFHESESEESEDESEEEEEGEDDEDEAEEEQMDGEEGQKPHSDNAATEDVHQ